MSQLEKIDMPLGKALSQPVANHNLVIAATLSAVVIVLIAALWVFVGNNPEVLDAAAAPTAFGIVAP